MQIEIDPLSDVPLYQQLRDRVVEGIAAGELAPGEQLSSVRQLALEFGINIATVSKGYELLRAEGLVRTHRASGSVVARGPRHGGDGPPWTDAARAGWAARLRTMLAEAVCQGESDDDVLDAARNILSDLATRRRANAADDSKGDS